MTADSAPHDHLDFFGLAVHFKLLTEAEAADLAERTAENESSPGQVALQTGLLDASQIDIIDTLLHPTGVIPGYEILGLIGRGGMGVVYRARQLNLDREVALKTILLSRMSDQTIAGRFEQEAQTVGKLRHPHIIAAYDFGRHEGRVFLAMEFVAGEDAETFIERQGQLDEQTACSITRQAAAGLAHAAGQDIVHRDVKPANLLLVEAPEGFTLPPGVPMVKIADFGLAFLTGDAEVQTRLTNPTSTVGSPHYMAPEQLSDAAVDPRADIYALGATLYHMLAGHPPFAGLNLSQIIAQKVSGGLKPLLEVRPTLSTATCRLVERMTARDPADRFQTYAELISAIDGRDHVATSTERMPAVEVEFTGPMTDGPAPNPADVAATQTMPLTGDTAYSFESSPVIQRPRWWQRQGVLYGLLTAGLLIALIGWGLLFERFNQAPIARVPMESTGWSTPLFYGTSTAGWQNLSGNWVVARDEEGANVLAGTGGVIARPLVLREDEAGRKIAPPFYKLDISAQPHAATAFEVHVGIQSVEDRNGERSVIRIEEAGVSTGKRASDTGPFQAADDLQPLPREWPSRHQIRIERLPTGWFVTVDGHALAPVPFRADGELPEIRLAVERGPAWFSDVLLEELTPASSDTSLPSDP